ncbi:MAG: GTPase Era [Sphaerochaetaceae bacterium]|jgi:GTP-binding protein Era|nr:GTPase Era [Sphaerochaetaceae bacterium]MDX9940319.1 GTPase Era [Sphaerochaetaceae bacterium]
MKCATVAIIGRPSSGKSTLVNTICERKVSITASTPQTTRNAIRGIYTDQRGQLILTDTPGYHVSEQALNLRLQETTRASLEDSDMILYMIDPKRPAGAEEQAIVKLLQTVRIPVVIAINKKDIAKAEELATARQFIHTAFPDAPVVELSAQKDDGVDEALIELFKLAPEGEMLYPEEAYTDQPLEFRISEIIREKAIANVTEEIPHAIYVEVSDLEYSEEAQSIWVRAFINVERETQKGILVGKGGEGIKKIRQASFKEIKRLFPGKTVQLDLRVKAQPKWRKNQVVLDRILS